MKKLIFLLSLALIGSIGIGCLMGQIWIVPSDLFGEGELTHQLIFWQLRLPRVLLASLVGGSLALAGVLYQGALRNPLADPYLLGVSGGGALGAALAMQGTGPGGGLLWVPLSAFVGALGAMALTLALSKVDSSFTPDRLLLAGIAINFLLAALLALLLVYTRDLTAIYRWLLGGMEGATWPQNTLLALFFFVSWGMARLFGNGLSAMSFGDDTATTLGIATSQLRIASLVLASLLAALCVALCGMIGFVGLMVPHLVRLRAGSHFHRLIVLSPWVGAILLVWADGFARTALAPTEIPVGILTALLGCPFFLYLLRRKQT